MLARGDLNGTDTFAEMTARIEAIRRRTGSAILARARDYEVGCIMISQPVFVARDDWVVDHAEWHPRIHMGKTIDVSVGDDQRIFAECLKRTARLQLGADPLEATLRATARRRPCSRASARAPSASPSPAPTALAPPSGEHSLPALEAARASLRGWRHARAPQRAAAARRHPPSV